MAGCATFPESMRLSKTYWIVCPKVTAALPKIVTFATGALCGSIDRFAPPQSALGHQGHGTKTDARITIPRGRAQTPGTSAVRSDNATMNSLCFPEPISN